MSPGCIAGRLFDNPVAGTAGQTLDFIGKILDHPAGYSVFGRRVRAIRGSRTELI